MVEYTHPHWDASALVVIDLQRDFLDDGKAPIPGTTAVLPNVSSLVTAFRNASRPIIHAIRLYPPGSSDIDLPRRDSIEKGAEVVAPGTDGSQVADGVMPGGVRLDPAELLAGKTQQIGLQEAVIFKPRWSAFYRTELESLLRAHDCDTVVVAGCNLPNCPRATLFDASERDFRTVLVHDAVSQTSPERLADAERIGATLHSTSDVLTSVAADHRS